MITSSFTLDSSFDYAVTQVIALNEGKQNQEESREKIPHSHKRAKPCRHTNGVDRRFSATKNKFTIFVMRFGFTICDLLLMKLLTITRRRGKCLQIFDNRAIGFLLSQTLDLASYKRSIFTIINLVLRMECIAIIPDLFIYTIQRTRTK